MAILRRGQQVDVGADDSGKDPGPVRVCGADQGGEQDSAAEGRELRRLALEYRGRRVLIDLSAVSHIQADGSYLRIRAGGHSYLLRERLKSLDRRLPSGDFCRVHRSFIVRLDRVESLEERGRGDLTAHLPRRGRVPVRRTFRSELERRLGTL